MLTDYSSTALRSFGALFIGIAAPTMIFSCLGAPRSETVPPEALTGPSTAAVLPSEPTHGLADSAAPAESPVRGLNQGQKPGQQGPPLPEDEAPAEPADSGADLSGLPMGELSRLFEGAGVHIDSDAGLVSIPATVEVRTELLEYLLVSPHGAAHESLFQTPVDVRLLNTALLTLGVKPGNNAVWFPKDPQPSEEELRNGVNPYQVALPEGDAFYLYAGWREGDETYFYRVEDMLRHLGGGRGMQRHAWVYLGSKMVIRGTSEVERFAAAAEGNLINVAFFSAGNTLLTASVESCVDQTVWMANPWLLPPSHSQVRFVFSRNKLDAPSKELLERLPDISLNPIQTPSWQGGARR
ncbi:MAG: hypothetical protein ACI835_002650 [Planctomycetota bacterium]|jgi:hypothetical protein